VERMKRRTFVLGSLLTGLGVQALTIVHCSPPTDFRSKRVGAWWLALVLTVTR